MGFLGDVGRAETGKQVTGFLKDVEGIKSQRQAQEINAQTQQLNDITLNKARVEEAKQTKITELGRQPKTFDSMFSSASLFAPNTVQELKGVTTNAGIVNTQGVTSAEKFQMWGQANPVEFKNFLDKGISEMDGQIAQRKQALSGGFDENGKFIPPDKNAEALQGQIQQIQRAQNALLAQSSTFEQEMAKTGAKESTAGTIGAISPNNFTVNSIAKYQQSGDISDLVRVEQSRGKGFNQIAAEKMMTEDPNLTFTQAFLKAKRTTPEEVGEREKFKKEASRIADFKKALPKARNTIDVLDKQWDLVDENIDRALTQITPFTTGLGAWTKVIPTTEAQDLSETLDTIKANIGFDKLQQMRADSPTGGALGQVSDFENKLLQAVKGSLKQTLSVPDLKRNLGRIKEDLQDLREIKRGAFERDYGEFIEEREATQPTGQPQEGQTATNPRTGEQIIFRGGEWQPL